MLILNISFDLKVLKEAQLLSFRGRRRKRGIAIELLTCTIVTSNSAKNYANTQKMADHNLLLVAIPEDTRKSEPTNQKNKLRTLRCYDF